MKSFNIKNLAPARWCLAGALALGLAGCQEAATKVVEAPAPRVDGEKITFPSGSPQISSIVAQPAEARTLAITHLTGRLYWNDETTVRIFTPVAGRVTVTKADLGDAVAAGTPLAEIDSPDFNQALANA